MGPCVIVRCVSNMSELCRTITFDWNNIFTHFLNIPLHYDFMNPQTSGGAMGQMERYSIFNLARVGAQRCQFCEFAKTMIAVEGNFCDSAFSADWFLGIMKSSSMHYKSLEIQQQCAYLVLFLFANILSILLTLMFVGNIPILPIGWIWLFGCFTDQ